MITALRWTRLILLGDLAVVVAIVATLVTAELVGLDIQSLKWPTVFYGGLLMLFGGVLSVLALTLQIIVAFRRRSEVK